MLSAIKNLLRPLIPTWMLNIYHVKMGIIAAVVYGFPSRRLKVIGITGTNGKTTTAHLVTKIFERAGNKVAMATTISLQIGTTAVKNNQKMTTMSPFALQRFLRSAVKAGCNVAVIEVTSHSLLQHRVWGIRFDSVALTNITHDHLDYHPTFNDYKHAKMLLFSRSPRVAVINGDDPSASDFVTLPAGERYIYSLTHVPSDVIKKAGSGTTHEIVARKIIASPRETMFTAVTPTGQIVIDNKLPGKFNVSNTLTAVGIGVGNGIRLDDIRDGIEAVTQVRGRMERVECGQPFTVIIDYAHTPDAFEKVFDAIAPIVRKRVIAVHGATGARDTTKRPILGAISGRLADIVVITNEDPYREDPLAIMKEVAAGVPKGAPKGKPKIENENVFLIEDRRAAIKKALELAEPRDVVLILGKGAEEVMAVGDPKADHGYKLIPWNEREIVKEELGKVTRSK